MWQTPNRACSAMALASSVQLLEDLWSVTHPPNELLYHLAVSAGLAVLALVTNSPANLRVGQQLLDAIDTP